MLKNDYSLKKDTVLSTIQEELLTWTTSLSMSEHEVQPHAHPKAAACDFTLLWWRRIKKK